MQKTLVILIYIFALGVSTYAQELPSLKHESEPLKFFQKSEKAIVGQYPDLDISFSSILEKEDHVVIDIRLRNKKQLIAQMNYGDETFLIQFISLGNGQLVKLTKVDLHAFHVLHSNLIRHLPAFNMSKVIDALISTLNLLEGYPPNEFFNVSKEEQKKIKLELSTSLCESIGEEITGSYTLDGVDVSTCEGLEDCNWNFQTNTCECAEVETVGPCVSGDCFGRCGSGCGIPPYPGIQRFTQTCFNHDLCCRKLLNHGVPKIWCFVPYGPCGDEWSAASHDFIFATDCANVSGPWKSTDSPSVSMDLTQFRQSPNITGLWINSESSCGTFSGIGYYDTITTEVTITFNIDVPNNDCCEEFTCTGNVDNCNNMSLTWTNACGRSGTSFFVRSGWKCLPDDFDQNVGPNESSK